jgi:hypothetical protein
MLNVLGWMLTLWVGLMIAFYCIAVIGQNIANQWDWIKHDLRKDFGPK